MTKLFNDNISMKNLRHSKSTNREVEKSTQRIASGSRINKAGDDAAGLSIYSKIKSITRSKQQAYRNTNDAFSILQVMEGSLQEIGNMVVRLRELSIASASAGYGDSERRMMNEESTQLISEINRIAKATEYMNRKVLNGQNRKLDVQVDVHGGEKHRISLDLKSMAQTPLALGIGDVKIDTQHRARLSLVKLDYAQKEILKSRTKLGALSNRLVSTVNKLQTDIESGESTASKIKDTDYAQETAENIKNKIVQHAQTSVRSQVIKTGKHFLKLLD